VGGPFENQESPHAGAGLAKRFAARKARREVAHQPSPIPGVVDGVGFGIAAAGEIAGLDLLQVVRLRHPEAEAAGELRDGRPCAS
jgi:hypothetical protein